MKADYTAYELVSAHYQSNHTLEDILRYDWNYQAEEEHPTNFALMAHTSLGSSFSSDSEVDSCSKSCVISLATLRAPKYDSLSSDYRQVLNLFCILYSSQVIDKFKTRLGYNAASSTTASPVVESFVISSEMLENQENNKSKSNKGYHVVPLPFTGNFMPRKPDLTFMDEIVKSENLDVTTVVTPIEPKTVRKNRFRPTVIEDWNSNDESEYKKKELLTSGCSRHMTGNKCYLTEYEDYDGGFVSFGDGKGRISGKGLTCLFAKAAIDEYNLWHRRPGHINFKNMNKLVRGNLVRGLPLKIFENDHSCVACHKGKQHKASYKAKLVNSISKPLHMLYMDLFGPKNVKSLMKKSYCLVVTDYFSIFSRVFFLATKDETSGILKSFITEIENQLDHKVKVIRYDNGTEFKNSVMNQFYEIKGIKMEFNVARTPQQNGVAERRNRTLIEAARTMLVNSKLPTTFWAEVVNTACYVLNRVLVIKPYNKTLYELIRGRTPLIDFMKPFGCPVTILNTRNI
ncbi:putative ribonuclease H-like domain-containing protein [Tanacetum coccineum]